LFERERVLFVMQIRAS